MANLENGCRWHFEAEGPKNFGPTDPMKGVFKRSTPVINIVREAIQNSLDARSTLPVRVSFRTSSIAREEFPAFFGLREHIRATLETWKDKKRARERFPRMIRALSEDGKDDAQAPLTDRIGVLVIGDENTTGMAYRPDDTGCAFFAFCQSIGVSADKGEGAGGSNGLGKNTLFAFSDISTILISSRTADGKTAFQGLTELATHHDPEYPLDISRRLSKFGVYGIDVREPVTDPAAIPVPFRRAKTGTDIAIVGVDCSNEDQLRNEIVRAVLNHFWLSVRDGLLEVDALGCVIRADNLGERICFYFPASEMEGQVSNATSWTPFPYWRALENAVAGIPKTAIEEKTLPHVGQVRLYLDWSSADLPKRIVYMRMPRMAIFKKGKLQYPPFAAVFVCLDKDGNEMLKDTEPPDHGSWDAANYDGDDKAPRKHALREVEDFVNRMLEKHLRPDATKNEIIIPGLADLLPDIDERKKDGETESGTVGSGGTDGLKPAGILSEDETAARSTFIDQATGTERDTRSKSNPGDANGLVADVIPGDNGEEAEVFQGPENEGQNPSPGPGPQPAGTPTKTTLVSKSGANTNIRVRVLARIGIHRKDGLLWHRLVVRPAAGEKREYCESVSLSLLTGGDDGKKDAASIAKVSGVPESSFDAKKGIISGIDIWNGAKLDVLFSDQIMHSVKVVAHATL